MSTMSKHSRVPDGTAKSRADITAGITKNLAALNVNSETSDNKEAVLKFLRELKPFMQVTIQDTGKGENVTAIKLLRNTLTDTGVKKDSTNKTYITYLSLAEEAKSFGINKLSYPTVLEAINRICWKGHFCTSPFEWNDGVHKVRPGKDWILNPHTANTEEGITEVGIMYQVLGKSPRQHFRCASTQSAEERDDASS